MPSFTSYFDELKLVWSSASGGRLREESIVLRLTMSVLILLRLGSVANLKLLFSPASVVRRIFVEAYVVTCLLLLLSVLSMPSLAGRWVGAVCGYIVAELIVYRIYFLLVRSREEPWRQMDLRRSLLFALLNVVEVVLAFAIIYQRFGEVAPAGAKSPAALSSVTAVYFSFVTFTTLGFGDFTPFDDASRILVILELVSGFLLLVFLIPVLLAGLSSGVHELANPDSGPSSPKK
jgi:hypothetical protein